MRTHKQLLFALTFLLGVVLLPAVGMTQENLSDHTQQRFAGALEVQDLGDSPEFLRAVESQQLQAMDHLIETVDRLLQEVADVHTAVVEAHKAWALDPTEAKKAEAVRAFSEAVARGRRAAVEMAFIGEESERLTRDLQHQLLTRERKLTGEIRRAQQLAQGFSRERMQAEQVVTEAKHLLEGKGTTGALSPELQEKLAQLRVDYQELEKRATIWSTIETQLQEQLAKFAHKRHEITEMNRLARTVAYQAGSDARVLADMGHALSLWIENALVLKAYSPQTELSQKLVSSTEKMWQAGQDLLQRFNIFGSLLRPQQAINREKTDGVGSAELLEWYARFGATELKGPEGEGTHE